MQSPGIAECAGKGYSSSLPILYMFTAKNSSQVVSSNNMPSCARLVVMAKTWPLPIMCNPDVSVLTVVHNSGWQKQWQCIDRDGSAGKD